MMKRVVFGCWVLALTMLLDAREVRAGIPEGEAAMRAGDFARAEAEVLPLAKTGDPAAELSLGVMYFWMHPPRPAEGKEWILKAAEQGTSKLMSRWATYIMGSPVFLRTISKLTYG